jgi:hypothetical protein
MMFEVGVAGKELATEFAIGLRPKELVPISATPTVRRRTLREIAMYHTFVRLKETTIELSSWEVGKCRTT